MAHVLHFGRLTWWLLSNLRFVLLSVVLGAFTGFAVVSGDEALIRWTAGGLQLLGVVAVVMEIRGAQKQYRIGFRSWIAYVWANRPRPYKRFNLSAGTISLTGSVAAFMHGRADAPADATVEDRVAVLERKIALTNQNAARLERAVGAEAQARTEALRAETVARETADREIGSQLEQLATGSLHVSLFGVVWLGVGVVLATAGPELVKWFGR